MHPIVGLRWVCWVTFSYIFSFNMIDLKSHLIKEAACVLVFRPI